MTIRHCGMLTDGYVVYWQNSGYTKERVITNHRFTLEYNTLPGYWPEYNIKFLAALAEDEDRLSVVSNDMSHRGFFIA